MQNATAVTPNHHVERLKTELVKALREARVKAETAWIYLTAQNPDPEQLGNLGSAINNIELALEHLGVVEGCSQEM